jgi:hypothetical protein
VGATSQTAHKADDAEIRWQNEGHPIQSSTTPHRNNSDIDTSRSTMSGPSRQANPLLLAADNPEELLDALRADPSLATIQDEHGYSLMHACASYNHLNILRTLVNEFNVNVDVKGKSSFYLQPLVLTLPADEDGETALFVAETMDCAKVLVEELYADITIRGEDDKTAGEKIAEEGDFPEVAVYLRMKELESSGQVNGIDAPTVDGDGLHAPPPLPHGVTINMGTMDPEDGDGEVVDSEFRRRIEELAQRDDFQGEEGQASLRNLITDAIRGNVGQEREVRRRLD